MCMDTTPGDGAGQSSKKKTIVFIVTFLENSKKFVIFTKSTNEFGEFLNFLGFCKILIHFLVFSYAFLNFLDFSGML